MHIIIKATYLFGFFLCGNVLLAQAVGHLYSIHNPSSGVFYFASTELSTGIVTDIEILPIGVISGFASACIDRNEDLYHFCTTTEIYSFDLNGVDPYSVRSIPLAPGASFFSIEYDPCDSSFIGIHNNYPNNVELVKLEKNSNTFQTIYSFPGFIAFCAGCQGMFDPAQRIYMMKNSNGIFGVDVQSGNLVYQHWIQDPIGFTALGHLAYDCQTNRILGTSIGTDTNGVAGKYLCELDPSDGIVSVLTQVPTQSGIFKPVLGGSCIDINNSEFYWSGMAGIITGASTLNGDMNYVQLTNSPEILLIEHYSGCNCSTTNITGRSATIPWTIYPNPAVGTLHISGIPPHSELRILDLNGMVLFSKRTVSDHLTIAVDQLSNGFYLVEVNGFAVKRFLVSN